MKIILNDFYIYTLYIHSQYGYYIAEFCCFLVYFLPLRATSVAVRYLFTNTMAVHVNLMQKTSIIRINTCCNKRQILPTKPWNWTRALLKHSANIKKNPPQQQLPWKTHLLRATCTFEEGQLGRNMQLHTFAVERRRVVNSRHCT